MDLFLHDDFIKKNIEELRGRITESSKKFYPLMKVGEFKSIEEAEAAPGEWVQTDKDTVWGELRDTHTWFKIKIAIDAGDSGRTVALNCNTGWSGWDATNPQFIVFMDGHVKQALDVNHQEICLPNAQGGESHEFYFHAYSGMEGGKKSIEIEYKVINDEIYNLYYDMNVPFESMTLLGENDTNRMLIKKYLMNAAKMLDLRQEGITPALLESVKAATEYMREEFYGKECGKALCETTTIGHTHIDVAWLWRLRQTREKAVRSFSTVLELMDRYPEYMFMSSQPQLYQFVKEDQPELYERIKERIKEGRWEPEGAMWLEADCNLTSGESLVRQVLFGKRFFKEEFGVDSKVLWLPDVFGYSAALPQILRKSGVDYFMTTKISWNEYNRVPMDSFKWKGIDGSEVLTHFIPTRRATDNWGRLYTSTYNGDVDPNSILGGWNNYLQKDEFPETLDSYGFGDGGGGPTSNMLEVNRRMAKGIPGMPKTKNDTALSYFRRLDEATNYGETLPKWVGELYFEYHRGTYTSMARNKKYNRLSELAYGNAELLCSINNFAMNNGFYPQQRINDGWRTILLNQFHDILPGSSIKEVYDDAKEDYERILADVRSLNKEAREKIAAEVAVENSSVVVFNQLGFVRYDVAEFELPEGWKCAKVFDGEYQLPAQKTEDGKVVFFATEVPAKGYKAFRIEEATECADDPCCSEGGCDCGSSVSGVSECGCDSSVSSASDCGCDSSVSSASDCGCGCDCDGSICSGALENEFYIVEFDENANIARLYDKLNDREVLKAGAKGNVLQVFEDKPLAFEAWDINIYYQNKKWEIDDVQSAELVEMGDIRTVVRVKRNFLDSTIEQDIILYNDVQRIDFKTRIDWKEKHLLLKALFPVDVHADKATYETQYGNLERPTHWNTSWDVAKFEVCAHKWADISEDGYGVSLLNDCKYGHDIKESDMRLTLIKSATDPNQDADREVHNFTYSLYPHEEDWKYAGTVQEAYNLNCPLTTVVVEGADVASAAGAAGAASAASASDCAAASGCAATGSMPAEFSMVDVDVDNVIIEVVKKAEDSDDMIIRAYECFNRRTEVDVALFKEARQVFECDLMENEEAELEVLIGDKLAVLFDNDCGCDCDCDCDDGECGDDCGDDCDCGCDCGAGQTMFGSAFSTVFKPYEIKTFKVKF